MTSHFSDDVRNVLLNACVRHGMRSCKTYRLNVSGIVARNQTDRLESCPLSKGWVGNNSGGLCRSRLYVGG